MSNNPYHERSLLAWGKVAPGWAGGSTHAETQLAAVTDWLIERADPQPGQVVLDVAAGAGGLGHRVAALVGPQGRVISTDFAPTMVEAARQGGDAQGLSNIDYRTLDAQEMDLADDSVDIVLCRSGIMLMADQDAAVRECARVLSTGGTLAFSVFTMAEDNPWATIVLRPFIQRGHVTPPEPGGPGMFALGDEDLLRELVIGAGFSAPTIETIDYVHGFRDDAAVWQFVEEIHPLLSPIAAGLDTEARNEMRAAVIEGFEPFRAADGSYRPPGRALGVAAQPSN